MIQSLAILILSNGITGSFWNVNFKSVDVSFESLVNGISVVSIRHASFPLTSSSKNSSSSNHPSSSAKRTLEPIFCFLREANNHLYFSSYDSSIESFFFSIQSLGKWSVPTQLKHLLSSFFLTENFLELPISNFLDVDKPNLDFLGLWKFFHYSNFPKYFIVIVTLEANST